MSPGEYNQCVDLFADRLFRFLLKSVRDEDLAKDLVQDTFEKAWLNHEDIPFLKAKSWLFTTGYRTMIDGIRRGKKMVNMEVMPEVFAGNMPEPDLKKQLRLALEKLPDIQRSVILLRDFEGYDYKEIGEITGLTESQVKVYIFRGRTALKKFLVSMDNLI
jgi:RNA polymerase sigma factor (sigma-70 family)